MVFSNVQVDRELASDLLSLNIHNRPLKQGTIDSYTEEMKKGKWKSNGDTIRISRTGVLLDSQHRLTAVIKSGVILPDQIIVCGLDDDVFDTIDTGRQRSAGDAVAIIGYKNYNTIAGATKLIMAYKDKSIKLINDGTRRRYTNQEVTAYLREKLDEDLIQECASIGNKCANKVKFFSSSTYAAFTYLFSEKSREMALLFMELLTSGANMSKTHHSPIFLLRSKLISLQKMNAALSTIDKYALLIKAWNLFRKQKEVGQLVWKQTEDFPTIQ